DGPPDVGGADGPPAQERDVHLEVLAVPARDVHEGVLVEPRLLLHAYEEVDAVAEEAVGHDLDVGEEPGAVELLGGLGEGGVVGERDALAHAEPAVLADEVVGGGLAAALDVEGEDLVAGRRGLRQRAEREGRGEDGEDEAEESRHAGGAAGTGSPGGKATTSVRASAGRNGGARPAGALGGRFLRLLHARPRAPSLRLARARRQRGPERLYCRASPSFTRPKRRS